MSLAERLFFMLYSQIFITLAPTYPECAYDGGNTKIKEYRTVPYNHLDFAGNPL